MFYTVKLIDSSTDASQAEIVWMNSGRIEVQSSNEWMQKHIRSLLTTPAFLIAPNRVTEKEFTDGYIEVKPDTIEMFYALQDILSWRGYLCTFNSEEHQSSHLEESTLRKGLDSDYMHTNSDGERIIEKVPEGYVAVSTDGQVVNGGGLLNANIDKDDAKWRLIENQYAQSTNEEREAASKEHLGKDTHHPGMFPKLYEQGEMKLPKPVVSRYMKQGKSLKEYVGNGGKEIKQPENNTPPPVKEAKQGKLKPGNIIYSPQLGVAMDTKFWDGADYPDKKAEWYVFSYPTSVEKAKDATVKSKMLNNLFRSTKSPMYIDGVQNGPVQVEKNLITDKGYKFTVPESKDSSVSAVGDMVINNPAYEQFDATLFDNAEYLDALDKSNNKTKEIRMKMHRRDESGKDFVDPSYEDFQLEDLDGEYATFHGEPRFYQKPIIEALTNLEQYEYYGGAKGVHGTFLNVFQGAGKTPMVIAAEGILRNRGIIKEGKQTTFAIVPSKTTHSFANKFLQFRKKPCTVIDGIEPGKSTPTKAYRIKQWEELVKKAGEGKLPHFVVIGVSKFREDSGENGEDDTASVDLQFMRLLNSGGQFKGENVAGGHVGLAILDESAHYLNPNTSRTKLMHDFVERLYQQKGLVWTLNGDITSNSATDLIMELSLINKGARDNVIALENHFTKTDPNRPLSENRIWSAGGLYKFMRRFGNQIVSLSGEAASKGNYGMKRVDDTSVGLGKEWFKLYKDALNTLNTVYDPQASGRDKRILGLLNVLVNISYGVLSPARAMEYDIGKAEVVDATAEQLTNPDDKLEFYRQINNYILAATETKNGKHVPKSSIPSTQRDKLFDSTVDERFRKLMESNMQKWSNPVLDNLSDDIHDAIKQSGSKVSKHGVAGISKRAIQALHKRLVAKFAGKGVDVLKFDGDTDSKTMAEQEKQHADKRRSTISLVTAAAGYSLSLPCEGMSYRFPCFNPAKGNQLEKRFHRNPEDNATIGVIVPSGMCAYMRDVENNKRKLMEETSSGAISDEGSEDNEFDGITTDGLQKLIEKINSRQYAPRVEDEQQ